ncbi:MAG TPA: MMPL family transporter [Dermatophilaceae bacterium]|nr:MMPL family transporter [Dermatophilaceae bacterium]
MGRVSQWAVRRPWRALLTWVGIMILVGILGVQFGGDYNDNFELPDTESTTAQELLADLTGGGAGTGAGLEGQVVWRAGSGDVTDPASQATMTELLTQLSTSPGVSCVHSPFGDSLGTQCPEPPAGQGEQGGGEPEGEPAPQSPAAEGAQAHFGQSGTSPDGTIAYATVVFEGVSMDDLSTEDVVAALDLIKEQNGSDGLEVGANGIFTFVGGEPPSSEAIGVTVALVILLFAFGSILGAFLPIVSAVLSVALTTTFVLPLVARYFDVATFAPILASMIGLGVGIDYSLFVINRYRDSLILGRSTRDAALESVRTSGRAVQFAAATVIIALLGLFVMQITFFNGIAVASAITVFMVMVGALLLLPAVLSLLGSWAFVGRMAWLTDEEAIPKQRMSGIAHILGRGLRYLGWLLYLPVTLIGLAWRWLAHGGKTPDRHRPNAFARYGNWLQQRPWVTAVFALVVMLAFALPILSLRLGFSDDSGTAQGSPPRIAYDLTAEGFGPGVNGPFYIAVQLPEAGDQDAVTALTDALSADPGVALAAAAPVAEDAAVAVIQVFPTTAPQDAATTELLFHLRDNVIPEATAESGAQAFVGGFQAVTVDFTKVLSDALPWFLLVVVGFGFLALMVLFRSILVPATGVLTSLLSLAAAMGVTVAVFQWGWTADLVGLEATGPIFPFLPVMVFAILFGLSCDYQVFLVSRMHEEWVHTADNRKAVRRGLAGSGRVVAIAAAIMASVFGAFVLGNDPTIKLFGVALSSAVLLDAFVVRLILIPSLMTIFGAANWWLPGWLERVLPHVSVESEEDIEAGADEIEDIVEPEESSNRAKV